jgi:hypothetical protein
MTDDPVCVPGVDPRPRFPIGWFKIAATDEIESGGLVERTFQRFAHT